MTVNKTIPSKPETTRKSQSALTTVAGDLNLSRYLHEIGKFPMLSEQEEQGLTRLWYESQDIGAAQRLVSSHLRIVPKIAVGYQGYGLPVMDLISEGNLGLMHAVKKFEPAMGYRFSTYAVWWVKAFMQDYILRSWSMVKFGSSAAQKKLFFNLKKLKNKIQNLNLLENKNIDENEYIAGQLNVTKREVDEMEQRLYGDSSLNQTYGHEESGEWLDTIKSTEDDQETIAINNNFNSYRNRELAAALGELSEREREIVSSRIMVEDKGATLEDLSQRFDISKERVRQIEAAALKKLKLKLQDKFA